MVEGYGYLPHMFTVLRSSAGAGKTHTLVKHYLTHCLRGDTAAYKQVLALTFTNKAAGEMRNRVTEYLEKLAKGELDSPALRDVMDHLVRESRIDEKAMEHRADVVLKHMVHHWGDVAISTIDAFTRRVVQPFARDLQLDHDLRMTTEEVWYRDRAVDRLVAEAGIDPQVTALLTEACRQLLEDEQRWDPARPLRELGKELSKEDAIAPLRALHDLDAEKLRPLTDRLRKENREFVQRMRGIGRAALELIAGAGLIPEDLYYGRTGFYGWFKKLASFGESWVAPGVQALKTFDGNKWESAKANASVKAALEAVVPRLLDLYQQGETLREGQRDHFIRKAVLRDIAPSIALRELDRCLSTLKQDDGVTFFSDLTRRVTEVVRDEPVPFIYERLGERYRHFLVDEFQDTSLMQWTNLLPLIDNALAQGGSALLVGDAKQAIYRWRNGEVRLFHALPKLFARDDEDVDRDREASLLHHYKPAEPLVDNHRSASTIVAFNNAVFGELAAVLPEELRSVYSAHEQVAHKKDEGLVVLEKLDKEIRGEESVEATIAFVLRGVREAIADGYSPGEIGVLVRAKKPGRGIAAALLAAGYAVRSPDGMQLSGDPVIELIIDLMRWSHTADPTAAARVMQYRHAILAGPDTKEVDPFAGTGTLPDPVQQVRTWLAENGNPRLHTTLTAFIAQLAAMVGRAASSDGRSLTLLDEAHAWSTEHGQEVGGFLTHWDRAGRDRAVSAAEDPNAVQVMTVHKAKGLEFPVVIVPNANMASGGDHQERRWIHPGNAVPELGFALVRENASLSQAAIPEIEEEEHLRILDRLDLLYVAFTRPKQRLYALVPERSADVVTKALLAHMAQHGTGEQLLAGVRTPHGSARSAGEEERFATDLPLLSQPALSLRFDSPERWDPADPDPQRRFGNAVHAVLARVHHAGDLAKAIEAVVIEGAMAATDAAPLTVRLSALLTSEALRPWYGEHLKVRTEASIITAQGRVQRPDRLVFDGDTVRVLDIKTGERDERHTEQVQRYMQLLIDLGYARVEGALLYVATGQLIPVAA